jgi:hypothetical protein
VLKRWLTEPGLCTSAMTAESSMHALPPLRDALMKLFSNCVRNGFIATDEIAPTDPPIAQQRNR